MTHDDIAARVAESRAAQGLPHRITDPATVDRVAGILDPVALLKRAVQLRPDHPVGIVRREGVATDAE